MKMVLLIAIGGSLGAVARYGLSLLTYHTVGASFPWGTLAVNLTGSFFIGILAGLFDAAIVTAECRSFLTIGFLGAFTTFSSFALESVNLWRDGEIKWLIMNILANNVAGILLVVLGMVGSRLIWKFLS